MISRRTFLAGTASMALLAACGASDDTAGQAQAGGSTTGASGGRVLGAGFADGYASPAVLIAGTPQRAPLVVFDQAGRPLRADAPDSIDVQVVHKGTAILEQTIPRHDAGIPTPYYPLVFTPPEAGDYEAHASLSSRAMRFRVADRGDVKLVQVGDRLRPVVTPTTTDARGVDPICTRSPASCPFHAVSLSDALSAARPVAFIISTPGFCQTAICGPVLELLIDASSTRPALQYVHAEVYVEPNKKTTGAPRTTEAIATYALDYEPTLFVADATGTVKARLDFSWDKSELERALATVA